MTAVRIRELEKQVEFLTTQLTARQNATIKLKETLAIRDRQLAELSARNTRLSCELDVCVKRLKELEKVEVPKSRRKKGLVCED